MARPRQARCQIRLREIEAADFDSVHALLSDWNVVQYMLLPLCSTPEETQKCLREMLAPGPESPWRSYVRAMVAAESGQVVGLCGIEILRDSEQGEIWYLVRPADWDRGIASQAARELLRAGFGELNLHRMFATCLPRNPGSARVLEKIGMRREGRMVGNLKIHGVWQDSFLYGILREEWERGANSRG
jgi:RimJ/RimL family protein N-acetyltransferase